MLQEGEADGTIVGGNLCTFNLLQGTPFMPSLDESIVFVEDDDRVKPWDFDRDLVSLLQRPGFAGMRSLVIGRFQKGTGMKRQPLDQVVETKPELAGLSVIANVDFGHTTPVFTFPVGGTVEVHSRRVGPRLTIANHGRPNSAAVRVSLLAQVCIDERHGPARRAPGDATAVFALERDRSIDLVRAFDPTEPMTLGLNAALEVGLQLGVDSDDPVVLQETNNTVVWLRPHPVIAKVGTRADSAEGILREHAVATALSSLGAPVVEPLKGSTPLRDSTGGFVVTLWHRLEQDPTAVVAGAMVGRSLQQVHQALMMSGVELPDYRLGLQRARRTLGDDLLMSALGSDNLVLLRDAFDALLPQLDNRVFSRCALHGEPHAGNYVVTASGIRWIDFESVCTGPTEWDLAFLPDDAREVFTDVDRELLALLSTLNSARVATWCWVRSRFPEMRRHGVHHLDLVRASLRAQQ